MDTNPAPPLFTWKRIWLFLVLIAAVWILSSARAVLTPLVAAFILAYLLNPIATILEKRCRIPRTGGVLLIIVALGVIMVLLWLSVAPLVERQIVVFGRRLPGYLQVLEGWVESLLTRFQIVPAAEVKKFVSENLTALGRLPLDALQTGGSVLLRTTRGLISIVQGLVFLLLIPVMMFYILRDISFFSDTFFHYIHPDYRREVRRRLQRLDEVLGSFIKGQLIVGLILSVLYSIGFFIVDVPLWLILGIFVGLISMFPYVEWIVGLPAVVALTALQHQDWLHILGALIVFAIISPIAGMYLIPRVVGGKVGLHPVVVLASVLIGGELLGFAGILLAVPLAAAIKVGLEALHDYYIGN
ncbi:MAG: AI-2E family transporter [bacterium]|nr:AI-2E family transporter [bacterium]